MTNVSWSVAGSRNGLPPPLGGKGGSDTRSVLLLHPAVVAAAQGLVATVFVRAALQVEQELVLAVAGHGVAEAAEQRIVAVQHEAGLGRAAVGDAGVAPGVEPPELVDALLLGGLPRLLGLGHADRADRDVAALHHLVVEDPLDLGARIELDVGQGVLALPIAD